MNTYDENLRAVTITLLQGRQLEQKNLRSQLNAASFTLYHAQGEVISAVEQQQAAGKDVALKGAVKEQIVRSADSSGNQLSTAVQATQFQKQAMTDAAVAAANVQVAANAIMSLAGDAGSIFAIVTAADFDTEIYKLAEQARQLMNDTAQEAEEASQLAMEASILAAQVPVSALYDKAKTLNAAMDPLRETISTGYTESLQALEADNARLAAASAGAKTAEGAWTNSNTAFSAALRAYALTNRELHLDLGVAPDEDGFTVRFRLITNPFADEALTFPVPVSEYFIIVVKETKATTFTLAGAEYLLTSKPECCTRIILPADPKTAVGQAFKNSVAATVSDGVANARFDTFRMTGENGTTHTLQDADGNRLLYGTRYVIFLFAMYTDQYKRHLNDSSDFLSAPSMPFCMKKQLAAVDADGIRIVGSGKQVSLNDLIRPDPEMGTAPYTLSFSIGHQDDPVEYRCMFLPANAGLPADLLTSGELESLSEEIGALECIAENYDPKIASLDADLLVIEAELQSILPGSIRISKLAEQYKKVEKQLADMLKAKEDLLKKVHSGQQQSGFFFNAAIAAQVSAGNYSVATRDTENDSADSKTWKVAIGPGTTDNFGDVLISGKNYIPVILSVAGDTEQADQFTNALTDIGSTPPFTYNQLISIK